MWDFRIWRSRGLLGCLDQGSGQSGLGTWAGLQWKRRLLVISGRGKTINGSGEEVCSFTDCQVVQFG